MERKQVTGFAAEELSSMCEFHATRPQTISRLVAGGVTPELIEDVLEIKDSLTDRGRVNLDVLIGAYQAADGDVDLLRDIAEHARRLAENIPSRARYSIALSQTTQQFLNNPESIREDVVDSIPDGGLI